MEIFRVETVATASTGVSSDPVSLSFCTPSLAGPSATLFPSLVSFTNETFVVDVADLGTDADSADILLEFARSADFASNLVSETRTVLDAGPQEFALAALDPGTEYWVRVTVAGANGKSTVLGPLRVPTPAYTAPWFGAVACTELWPDSATVAVPLAALGDGSSYADVEWTLLVGSPDGQAPSGEAGSPDGQAPSGGAGSPDGQAPSCPTTGVFRLHIRGLRLIDRRNSSLVCQGH